MDDLSSADLDSPSKTPLFLGISALIIALAGLALGWLGFTKAGELEARMGELAESQGAMQGLESQIAENGKKIEQLSGTLNNFSRAVQSELQEAGDDISDLKKNIRSVTIQAGTALKKVEELEEKGIKVATAAAASRPAPTAAASPTAERGPLSKSPTAAASPADGVSSATSTSTYKIEGGDTLAAIANRFGISLAALMEANPGVDPRRLRIGQEIVLPKPD